MYLGLCQTSMMKLFCKKSQQSKAANYFCIKDLSPASLMVGRVRGTPLYRITGLNNLVNSQERTCEGDKPQFLLKADST